MAETKKKSSKKTATASDPFLSTASSDGPNLKHKARANSRKILVIALSLLVLLFAYGYVHTRNQLNKLNNPQLAAKNETQGIISRINQVVDLPGNETPTLATVKDASKFRSNSLFNRAKNGDKLIIYPKANVAILYRPSIQKVVEYGPVNTSSDQ